MHRGGLEPGRLRFAHGDGVTKVFSRIDILVNAFGFRIRHPAVGLPVHEWQQVMDINSRGTCELPSGYAA